MAHEKEWTIWLRDGSGEEPLGLQPTQAGTRFRVWGKMKEEAFGFGVWIEVQGVQELTLGANTVTQTWVIKPPTCLIPAEHGCIRSAWFSESNPIRLCCCSQ